MYKQEYTKDFAYPGRHIVPNIMGDGLMELSHDGMTLLDYFAGQAMIDVMNKGGSNPNYQHIGGWGGIADYSYKISAAMMEERKKYLYPTTTEEFKEENLGLYMGDQIPKCPSGLYRITWNTDDRTSVAAIGVNPDGSRWIAPTNWVAPGQLENSLASVKFIQLMALQNTGYEK